MKNDELYASFDETLTKIQPFDKFVGGLYDFGTQYHGWGLNEIAFFNPSNKDISKETKVEELKTGLRAMLDSTEIMDAAGRKEIFETVLKVTQLDSTIDFDNLYIEMIRYYNDRKQTA